jgi:hypothetical protein
VELDEYIESLTDMYGMRVIKVGIDGIGRPGIGFMIVGEEAAPS